MVINARRASEGKPPLTEDDLINLGIAHDLVGHDPAKMYAWGATSADGRQELFRLPEVGLDTTTAPNDPSTLQNLVAEGYPVSASVHPYYYWPSWTGAKDNWNHQVLVIGVQYDEEGNVAGYIINDTGLGKCGLFVPKANFERSLIPGAALTVGTEKM